MLKWTQIQGHERTRSILVRAVESERIHHAYLFTGPDGVGKRTTALSLAASLNCEKRSPGTFAQACGTCLSCRKMWPLQHPDLHLIEPEGARPRIKIDQVRVLQKAATTRPYEGRFQIVIIDDAHYMTPEAANALLKTLEEPPSTMRLILVTDQPHMLLDTILSRCQRVPFGPLDREIVVRLLEADPGEADSEAIRVASGYAEGSLGRAKSALESGVLEERKELIGRLKLLSCQRPFELLEWADQLARDRGELNERLDLLKILFRDLMLIKTTDNSKRLVNADLEPELRQLSAVYSVKRLMSCIDSINRSQQLQERNVNAKLIVEALLAELAPDFKLRHAS